MYVLPLSVTMMLSIDMILTVIGRGATTSADIFRSFIVPKSTFTNRGSERGKFVAVS